MINASELRAGMAISYQGQDYRVVAPLAKCLLSVHELRCETIRTARVPEPVGKNRLFRPDHAVSQTKCNGQQQMAVLAINLDGRDGEPAQNGDRSGADQK